jgi:hypothetical protein
MDIRIIIVNKDVNVNREFSNIVDAIEFLSALKPKVNFEELDKKLDEILEIKDDGEEENETVAYTGNTEISEDSEKKTL